jgi:hypothetical protein
MKVKRLKELLALAGDDDTIVINVDGSIYPVDTRDTEEQLEGYQDSGEFGISVDLNGCP